MSATARASSGGSRPREEDVVELEIAVADPRRQRRERGEGGGALADLLRERPDQAGQPVPRVGRDRFLEPREVAGRIVDADAQAGERVVETLDGGVKSADQRAGGVRLRGIADHVERDALDVRLQPPDGSARRDEVRPPVARRQEARRHHAGGRQPLGHRHDVAVNRRREDRAHRLQHGTRAVRARQQIAAVDEACPEARDRRALPPGVAGQDVGGDLGGFVPGVVVHGRPAPSLSCWDPPAQRTSRSTGPLAVASTRGGSPAARRAAQLRSIETSGPSG